MSVLTSALFVYFVVYTLYAVGMGLTANQIMKRRYQRRLTEPCTRHWPPVTIIVPAFNEAVVLEDTLRNLCLQTYPCFDLIVVNDGSTDDTLARLQAAFALQPGGDTFDLVPLIPTASVRGVYATSQMPGNCRQLIVIDKVNGGKADAFNAALNLVANDYVVTVDADTVLVPTALVQLMEPVRLDPLVVAVGAQVGVMNSIEFHPDGSIAKVKLPGRWLQGVQVLEYMKTFMIYRTGHDAVDASLLISGSCGLFKTSVLMKLGGYDTTSVCEDIEMTMRVQQYVRAHKLPLEVEFIGNPVAWTQVPATFRDLAKQRNRWFRGAAHALWKFRSMTFSRKMGAVGWFSVPMYWLFGYLTPFTQLLLLSAVVLDVIAAGWQGVGPLLLVGVVVASVINLIAISLLKYTSTPTQTRRDKLRLFWYGLLEMFVVLFFYMFVNLRAAWDALRGNRSWNKVVRTRYRVLEPTND